MGGRESESEREWERVGGRESRRERVGDSGRGRESEGGESEWERE